MQKGRRFGRLASQVAPDFDGQREIRSTRPLLTLATMFVVIKRPPRFGSPAPRVEQKAYHHYNGFFPVACATEDYKDRIENKPEAIIKGRRGPHVCPKTKLGGQMIKQAQGVSRRQAPARGRRSRSRKCWPSKVGLRQFRFEERAHCAAQNQCRS